MGSLRPPPPPAIVRGRHGYDHSILVDIFHVDAHGIHHPNTKTQGPNTTPMQCNTPVQCNAPNTNTIPRNQCPSTRTQYDAQSTIAAQYGIVGSGRCVAMM